MFHERARVEVPAVEIHDRVCVEVSAVEIHERVRVNVSRDVPRLPTRSGCRRYLTSLVAGVCLFHPSAMTRRVVDVMLMLSSDTVIEQRALNVAANAVASLNCAAFSFGYWNASLYAKTEPFMEHYESMMQRPLVVPETLRLAHLLGMKGTNAAVRKIYLLREFQQFSGVEYLNASTLRYVEIAPGFTEGSLSAAVKVG